MSHRETPGSVLHPVPLPRGGGEPADHRRDRPVRQDPRVQVLRGPDRAAGSATVHGSTASAREPDGLRVQARVPGREARAGKFPGPSLIPALNAIQREHGWLPREELVRLARETRRPLYEIEGLISFYPHFRTVAAARREVDGLPRPLVLAARRRRADRGDPRALRRRRRDRGASRSRASGAATSRRPRPSTSARCRSPRSTPPSTRRARRRDEPPEALRRRRRAPGPNDPYAAAPAPSATRLRDAAIARRRAAPRSRIDRDAEGLRPARHGRRRLPDGREVGDRRQPGARAEVRDLQRRRVRAGHVQGPPDPGRAAPPRDRGDARSGCSRPAPSRAGSSSATSTAPRRRRCSAELERRARRASSATTCWARGRRLEIDDLHLAGRLHPRRGVGAARVHGGPPRRAAQQAAVPRACTACGASRR